MPRKRRSWFALSVHPEYPEKEVRAEITREAKRHGVKGVGRVILCRHKETKVVGGREQVHRVKSYPGYLILSLDYCAEVQVLLDGVKGVVGLLPLRLDGAGVRPAPTALGSQEAVELLLRQELARKDRPNAAAGRIEPANGIQPARTSKLGLEKGEQVVITVGPFKGTTGQVSKVLNRSEVALNVTLMGKLVTKVVAECDLQRS